MKINLALITGIIRDDVAADVWGTLAQVADMGYQGIEFGPGLSRCLLAASIVGSSTV